MKKKIAWFTSEDNYSLSNLYTNRVLNHLKNIFEIDVFSIDADTSYHYLRFRELDKVKKYDCVIALIEDKISCTFANKIQDSTPCLGLVFDSNLIDIHFYELLQSSVGSVFDEFSNERLGLSDLKFGKFRDRKWDIEVFKSFLFKSNADCLNTVRSLFLDNDDNKFYFPFEINSDFKSSQEKNSYTVGISPKNFLTERFELALNILNDISKDFDIELACFCEDHKSYVTAKSYVDSKKTKSNTVKFTYHVSFEEFISKIPRCDLFWSLNSRYEKSPNLCSILALEHSIPSLIFEGSQISYLVQGLPFVRAGISEDGEILALVKSLLGNNKLFSNSMKLNSSIDTAIAALISSIDEYILNCADIIKKKEKNIYSSRVKILETISNDDNSQLLEIAKNDFKWLEQ